MKRASLSGMLEATRLTAAGRLNEATTLLQRMLEDGAPGGANRPPEWHGPTIDGVAESIETHAGQDAPHAGLPETLRSFLDRARRGEFQLPAGPTVPFRVGTPAPVPDGARFLAKSFSNQEGSRPYKLYVPSGYKGEPIPLIVMLHGCTQSADDFAAGTRMNTEAEAHTCLVVYPEQTATANGSKCWNWFAASGQQRDRGEPSLIAGITRQVMREYAADPQRVYVAGLSAGAAAAAVMGVAYPDLYAAIGVHSGLACGSAEDLPSAFAAMRGGKSGRAGSPATGGGRRIVPAIVFHGDRDTTVHPCNGDHVVDQFTQAMPLTTRLEEDRVPGGLAFSRTLYAETNGRTVLERWVIHGAGHAWSGGSPAGSYTDPRGPDATREMLRFFREHPNTSGPDC